MHSMDFPCAFAERIDQTVGDHIEDGSQQFFKKEVRKLVIQVQLDTATVVTQRAECPLSVKSAERAADEFHPDG